MFKLAAVTAVAAASTADFQETAEMFQIRMKQEELEALEKHGKALEYESKKYEMQMQNSHHGKQFEMEVQALAKTHEVQAVGKFVEAMHKRGPTPQIKKFKQLYMAQMHKVEAAHMALKKSTHENSKWTGQQPHARLTVNVDEDEWVVFNKEYYKLREMEYYAMYKIPEFVAFRGKVTAVRHTGEFQQIQEHWATVTHQDQHQVVVKHQADMIKAIWGTLHMTDRAEAWISPKHAPVMFEAWHAIYLYFVAMGKGDLNPMLDFVIDGKYDEEFAKHVDPDFGAPELEMESDLFLF